MTTQTAVPPQTSEDLRNRILGEHENLSKALKRIGRFILDEPNAMAFETLTVLADQVDVQPSAIVRFAKHFGFDGASQMQKLLRDELLSNAHTLGYTERVRQFRDGNASKELSEPKQVLSEFVSGNIFALENLDNSISAESLDAAVDLMDAAQTIYISGVRRSFPIAAYLAYSLQQTSRKAVLIDNVGGMAQQQVKSISRDDLLMIISFTPYATETVELANLAKANGGKVLSISDSQVSPVARSADLTLLVREAEIRNFRSLSVSMCLAQSLVIALAFARPETSD